MDSGLSGVWVPSAGVRAEPRRPSAPERASRCGGRATRAGQKGGRSSSVCVWASSARSARCVPAGASGAGLAGLRVGYGLFPEWLSPHLWKIKQPYNVNVAASLAVLAALEDIEWLRDKLEAIVAEREALVMRLTRFPFLVPFPSHSNFVLFRVEDRSAAVLKRQLEQEGVLVRYFQKPGLENCIRISAGRPQDTDRLIAALDRIVDQEEVKQ